MVRDPNRALGGFCTLFTHILNKYAPIKVKRVKREFQPVWYNNDIKHASKQTISIASKIGRIIKYGGIKQLH